MKGVISFILILKLRYLLGCEGLIHEKYFNNALLNYVFLDTFYKQVLL